MNCAEVTPDEAAANRHPLDERLPAALEGAAKSRHRLEEGDPLCLSNLLKALDSSLRGNDAEDFPRLFAVTSL
jgi:hypothetical protein